MLANEKTTSAQQNRFSEETNGDDEKITKGEKKMGRIQSLWKTSRLFKKNSTQPPLPSVGPPVLEGVDEVEYRPYGNSASSDLSNGSNRYSFTYSGNSSVARASVKAVRSITKDYTDENRRDKRG